MDPSTPQPAHERGPIHPKAEPRGMTLADLGVVVAGAALVLVLPWPMLGWPMFLGPPPPLYLVAFGGVRLTSATALVIALAVAFRRLRYGGPVRPPEWLALVLAACGLLEVVSNLDTTVNTYYIAVGSHVLNFGTARWLFTAPATAGCVVAVAWLAYLRRRTAAGSRSAAALMVVVGLAGLVLWLWGPCEVARLELPYLVVPSPPGQPTTWGWRLPVVEALRNVVRGLPLYLTWGLPAAATLRAWRTDGRRGRAWTWTEWAGLADVALAALVVFPLIGCRGPLDAAWLTGVGLVSWWVTGRLGGWPGFRLRNPPQPPCMQLVCKLL